MPNWIQRFLTAIATHKADASAHHAKTTSFADITDRAGKDKLQWTLNKLLKGAGAVADPTEIDVPSATKEVFFIPTFGTEIRGDDNYAVATIDANPENAWITGYIPHDFTSIVEMVVVRIADATATHRLNYDCSYGAVGEDRRTHSDGLWNVDTAETVNLIYETDVSGMFGSLAAGDYIGMQVTSAAVNVPADHILGLRLKYS